MYIEATGGRDAFRMTLGAHFCLFAVMSVNFGDAGALSKPVDVLCKH